MNKILIIGNVGSEPQFKEFDSGSKNAIFDVGVNERQIDKQGNVTKSTEWFKCIVWNKPVDFIKKYVSKGSKVFVEGKMKSRVYTNKDGIEMKIYELNVEKFELLSWDKQTQEPTWE